MITYINKNADVKNFNTWTLSVNRTMKQKELTVNNMIRYLEQMYRSYVKHYNELQDLQKYIDNLTGESRYSKRDYSYYPSISISSTFNVNFGNVRLVKGGELLKFKNCIEDVRKNLLDVQVEIKEIYNNTIKEVDPYGSMYSRTNDIREHGSSIATNVSTNISTALSEGDLTTGQLQEMKDLAERETNEKEKSLVEPEPSDPTEPSKEDLEREAREAAEKAFNEEQDRLDKAAADAANKANEANAAAAEYSGDYASHVDHFADGTLSNDTYTDPTTGEAFKESHIGDSTSWSYYDPSTDSDAQITTGGVWGDKYYYDGTEYDSYDEAAAAANEDLGKEVFTGGGWQDYAEKTYNEGKESTEAAAEQANKEAADAANAAKEHQDSGSSSSSGGT